jgi:tetratricopeptide (TPR) repeat protein
LALSAHYSRYGILGKSLEVLEAGLRKSPQNAALHVAIASAFTLIRNDGAAEQHYRRAIALSVHAKIPYALWLIGQGRNDEALTVYREIRQDSPRNGVAFYGIVQTQPGAAEDESLILEMRRLLEEPGLETASRMYLCYGLAKICEQQKNYQASMGYYDQANDAAFELQNASIRFDIERIRDDFRRVTACYEELVRSGVWGVSGPAPIFIVGMIRSGTTLLDQIISSHSQVANAGELRFWIEKSLWLAHRDPRPDRELLVKLAEEYLEYARLLAGEGQTFTDKMPLNYSSIGLIHRTLPDARFVHIRRHPVDTCLSIYTTYFGAGAEFYHHKANTVAYYREYLNAMNYWRSQIPQDRLLEIQYEELVAEPEPVVRKVIDFCGLPWDKACLHHEQNRSAISTPSRWQARQPVYKSSLERWRKYEPWLGEFAELLPPFAT